MPDQNDVSRVAAAADFLNGMNPGAGDDLVNELNAGNGENQSNSGGSNANVEEIGKETAEINKGAQKKNAGAQKANAGTNTQQDNTASENSKTNGGTQGANKNATAADADDDSELLDVRKEGGADTFKTLEDFTVMLKKEFGIEDPSKAREAFKEWRKQSQNAAQATQQYKNLAGYISKLPKHLYDLMDSWGKGNDEYALAVQRFNNSVDYSLPWDKQNKQLAAKELMPHLNTTDKSRNDFVDLNNPNDPYTQSILRTIEAAYEGRSKAVKEERGKIEKAAQQRAASVTKSIDASVQTLSQTFPRASQERLQAVTEAMAGNDLESLLFMDENEHYTPNAALRIYMALFGDQEVGKLKRKISALQDRVDELLSKGSDKVNEGSRSGNSEQVPNELKQVDEYFPKRNNQLSYEVVKQ